MWQKRWLYECDTPASGECCQCRLQQLHLADSVLLNQKFNQ
jgi:hypothetical protein